MLTCLWSSHLETILKCDRGEGDFVFGGCGDGFRRQCFVLDVVVVVGEITEEEIPVVVVLLG